MKAKGTHSKHPTRAEMAVARPPGLFALSSLTAPPGLFVLPSLFALPNPPALPNLFSPSSLFAPHGLSGLTEFSELSDLTKLSKLYALTKLSALANLTKLSGPAALFTRTTGFAAQHLARATM